jgi:putative membrane protein
MIKKIGNYINDKAYPQDNPEEVYRFKREEIILRDMLAMDRTILANERTVLAWLRTSMSLVLAGVSFIEFLDVIVLYYVGWILIYGGLATLVIGIWKYLNLKKQLHTMKYKK